MNVNEQSELLFDALLFPAVSEAFQTEIENLPPIDELNDVHKPSPELDYKIKKFICHYYRKANSSAFQLTSQLGSPKLVLIVEKLKINKFYKIVLPFSALIRLYSRRRK